MDPVETRLHSLERTSTEMQVVLARIEERQIAHAALTATQNAALTTALAALTSQVDPLREQSWRQRGAATVWGLLGGVVVTLAAALLRMWK